MFYKKACEFTIGFQSNTDLSIIRAKLNRIGYQIVKNCF